MRDPFESMQSKHVLALDRQLPQITEKLFCLFARQQLPGRVIQFAGRAFEKLRLLFGPVPDPAMPQAVNGKVVGDLEQVRAQQTWASRLLQLQYTDVGFLGDFFRLLLGAQTRREIAHQHAIVLAKQLRHRVLVRIGHSPRPH
ncbi:MAG: hypothetical protein WA642_16180 [Steroidobacteraceae bacterium]